MRLRYVAAALAALSIAACALRAAPRSAAVRAAERYAAYLESPDRAKWQKPDEVVAALGLRGGETVTDLGAGSGYFARRLAGAVGRGGTIDAVDIDPALLAMLRESLRSESIENVSARAVSVDDPALLPSSRDLVFLCNTYHQIRDREAYLKKLAAGLKPSGRVVVIDFHKRDDIPEGPALREKLAREDVVAEFRHADFELAGEESFLPYQYFLVFRRPSGYSFDRVAAEISEVMRSAAEAREKQWQVAALLSDYLHTKSLEAKFQRMNPALPVTTYLLYDDPTGRFSIASLVFRPKARTTVHDHQSWVVWGTYAGREQETRYRAEEIPGQAFPGLTPVWSQVFDEGGVSFIPPPPDDIHDVENLDDAVSVSIHVHATDIAKQARNSYDIDRKVVRQFVQTYEPAL